MAERNSTPVPAAWKAALAATLAASLALLAGCTNDAKLREAELQKLAVLLPGQYDNRVQVTQAGAAAELPLELNVTPIYAPFLSDYVFYVQENAWGDPRRVLSQRLFVFDLVGGKQIVQRVFGFAEPVRWRDGHLNTDLFKGQLEVQQTDVVVRETVVAGEGGCRLELLDGLVAGKAASEQFLQAIFHMGAKLG